MIETHMDAPDTGELEAVCGTCKAAYYLPLSAFGTEDAIIEAAEPCEFCGGSLEAVQ